MALQQRMLSRRQYLQDVGLVVHTGAVALLASCRLRGGSTGEQAPEMAGGPQVTIWFFWLGPATSPYQYQAEEKVTAFTQRFPQYPVKLEIQPSDYATKLTAMYVAGDAPHVFYTDHQEVLGRIKQGMLQEVSSLAKGDRHYNQSEYVPQALEAMTVQGKLYGLSSGNFTGGFWYNAALFRNAGLPTPPELLRQGRWTWDTFLDVARTLTQWEGSIPVQLGLGASVQHRLFLNSNGAVEVDDVKLPKKSGYDDPRAIDAVQLWADTGLKHRVRAGWGENEFLQGKLAMYFAWTTRIAVLAPVQEFNWGMVPIPKGPAGTTPAGDFTFWGITMSSLIKDERVRRGAWEWMKFYCGKEGQMIEGGKYMLSIPYVREAMEEWRKNLATTRFEHPEVIFESRDRYSFQRIMAPNQAEIVKLQNDALAPVWRGEASAREGCLEAARAVNEYLRLNPQTVP